MRRAAGGDFPLHGGANVVAHHRHGIEQLAQLVAAGGGDLDIELACGDAPRRARGQGNGADHAPRQQDGDGGADEEGEEGRGDAEATIGPDRCKRALAVLEAVIGGELDELVEIIEHDGGAALERRVVGAVGAHREEAAAQAIPVGGSPGGGAGLIRRGLRHRPFFGDAQIFRERLGEIVDVGVELMRAVGIRGGLALHQRQLHGREVGQRQAGIADRHQRLVIGLHDQAPGLIDAVDSIPAEKPGDRRKRAEGQQNLSRIVMVMLRRRRAAAADAPRTPVAIPFDTRSQPQIKRAGLVFAGLTNIMLRLTQSRG